MARTWISMINRGGTLVPATGDTVLNSGDEVVVLTDPDTDTDISRLFTADDNRPAN